VEVREDGVVVVRGSRTRRIVVSPGELTTIRSGEYTIQIHRQPRGTDAKVLKLYGGIDGNQGKD
jgi:hypothetical protein